MRSAKWIAKVVLLFSFVLVACEKPTNSAQQTCYVAVHEIKRGEKLDVGKVRLVKETDIESSSHTLFPVISSEQTTIEGKTAAYSIYPGQTISELDIGKVPDRGEVRAVFAIREIPSNTVITSQMIKCKWKRYGKGIPDGPQLELTQIIGRTARNRIQKDWIVTATDLKDNK